MQFSNGDEISNNTEDENTLISHILEQMKPINCNVIVHAMLSTDVFFLLLKHCKVIRCYDFYVSLACGFVYITALMNKLVVKASYVLLSLHVITCSDCW